MKLFCFAFAFVCLVIWFITDIVSCTPFVEQIATALFANSPFTEGKPNGYLSFRR